ncbi:MAG TPA: S8 family serine peptidase [Thermoanaerobaculia bacterium]|nr:S8 family serine peptidase [Thermoanaerobaculia bacterium]
MRPLAAVTLALCLSVPAAESADRYFVATRTAPAQIAKRAERRVRTFGSVHAYAATLTASEVAELRKSADVRFVVPTVPRYALDAAAAPLAKSSDASAFSVSQTIPYGIAMVHAPEVWKVSRGAGPINVAVLDTGIDAGHPDLASNYAGGFNTFDSATAPVDENGHGTHVSGIIAAADNGIGVVGVAPEVRVWAVKVLDKFGFGADENIVAGIDWVIQKKREIGGDWVINMSLGASGFSDVEHEAVNTAIADGILIAAASGNRGFDSLEYPAAYAGVIAVGAIDSTETIGDFSDRGPNLAVVAPGIGVISTAPRGSVPAAGVTLSNGSSVSATTIQGSGHGDVKSTYIFCGVGNPQDFPAEVSGKIALIKRGDITFNDKVRNAQAAGALAVVVFNKDDSDFTGWTLLRPGCDPTTGCDDNTRAWPVVLAVSAADGQRLLDDPSHVMDMGAWFDDYKYLTGTSQATPHVAGTLALVWSLDPFASADSVKQALLSTAKDLGAPGVDTTYGEGLINALAAARRLAPWRFEPQPPALPAIDPPRALP